MNDSVFYIAKVERPFFTMGLRSDRIIHTVIKDGVEVNRALQDEFIEALLEVKKGIDEKLPSVVQLGEFLSVVHDSLPEQINEFAESLLCIVICAENAGHRLLANFYNLKFQPLNEFIIVKDFERAIEYAKKRLHENDNEPNPPEQ